MNSNIRFSRENSHLLFGYLVFILLACLAYPCLAQETQGLAQETQGLAQETQDLAQETPGPAQETPGPAQEAAAAANPEFATRHPRYQMGLGDVIDIDFPLVPEFNQSVTVQPDGFISLKSAGDIHVHGLTSPETVEAIRAAYKNILHDPVLAITLKDFEKPYFTALGKVNKPGKYDLRGDTTVTQAIAIAGGFDDAAKHSQVLLFRHMDKDRIEIKTVDVKAMLKGGNMEEDFHLRPGDMIMVPKSTLSKLRPWIPNQSLGMYMNGF